MYSARIWCAHFWNRRTLQCQAVNSVRATPNTHIVLCIVHVFGTLIQSLRQTFLASNIFRIGPVSARAIIAVCSMYIHVAVVSIHVPCMRPIFSHWVVFKFSYRIIRHVDLSVVSRKAITTLNFSCCVWNNRVFVHFPNENLFHIFNELPCGLIMNNVVVVATKITRKSHF